MFHGHRLILIACKKENFGAIADFAMSMEASVPGKVSPIPPLVTGVPKAGATKPVDALKG